MRKKKERISPNSKKVNKCFLYAVTVALNHEKIQKNPEKNNKNKTFINKHNLKEINSQQRKDCWKKFEKNNV